MICGNITSCLRCPMLLGSRECRYLTLFGSVLFHTFDVPIFIDRIDVDLWSKT